jgi:hypothetical protein
VVDDGAGADPRVVADPDAAEDPRAAPTCTRSPSQGAPVSVSASTAP